MDKRHDRSYFDVMYKSHHPVVTDETRLVEDLHLEKISTRFLVAYIMEK